MILCPYTPASGIPATPALLTGVTYGQVAVFSGNTAADYTSMNDGLADGSLSSSTATTVGTNRWIQADVGSVKYIDHVVVGYDYLSNLPGGFGPTFLEGCTVNGSNSSYELDGDLIATLPSYGSTGSSNGLYSVSVAANYRYIRIFRPGTGYIALLEFQVWGY